MELSLFKVVSAIEVLNDAGGTPQFKRTDLGRFLRIVDMRNNFTNIATKSRSEITADGAVGDPTLLQFQNDHDVFVNLENALGSTWPHAG